MNPCEMHSIELANSAHVSSILDSREHALVISECLVVTSADVLASDHCCMPVIFLFFLYLNPCTETSCSQVNGRCVFFVCMDVHADLIIARNCQNELF